jgi:hypothetical protein
MFSLCQCLLEMMTIFHLFYEITCQHDVTVICFSLIFLATSYMRVSEKNVLKRSFIVAVIDEREMRHYLFFAYKRIDASIHKNKYLYLCKCVTKHFSPDPTEVMYMLLYFV